MDDRVEKEILATLLLFSVATGCPCKSPRVPSLLLLMLLSADPIRLAAPKMQVTNVDARVAEPIGRQLAQELAIQPGLRVTTPEEISTLLGLDRQKVLLGCAETCTAELAGALGVDAVILSSVSLVGSSYLLNIKAIGAADGRQLSVISQRVPSVDALLDAMSLAAKQVATDLRKALRPSEAAAPVAAVAEVTQPTSPKAWIPGVVGGALALGGGVLYGLSKLQEARIRAGDPADVDAAIATGKTEQAAGAAVFSAGATAIAAAVIWGLVFEGKSVQAGVSVTPQAVSVGVTGRFP